MRIIKPCEGGERSKLHLSQDGLEKQINSATFSKFGRVAVKIPLQSNTGLQVITLCCLITVPLIPQVFTRVYSCRCGIGTKLEDAALKIYRTCASLRRTEASMTAQHKLQRTAIIYLL